jgi:class 3 adenylate cyclase/tetratricopeptide (TPR) repeat protein
VNPLVPEFILQKDALDQTSGTFEAATLVVDIAGFSSLTSKLMQHGREGAETLARALRFYFDPTVAAIEEGGGFITGFAGDSATALFPHTPHRSSAEYALDAADRMLRFVEQNRLYDTSRFGGFPFSIRVGLSWGRVDWGIVRVSPDRSYFYFIGPALESCAVVERMAKPGEVLLDTAFRRRVPRAEATHVEGDVFRGISVAPPSQRLRASYLPMPQQGARFLGPHIKEWATKSEFRDVVSVFLAFEGASDLPPLITQLHELALRYGGTFTGIDFNDKGTNTLIHFGAPVAHENDSERALDFALELRRTLPRPMRLRGGITRDVRYVGMNGGARRHDFACLGRATILAARMMMRAPWGEIYCDPKVALDAQQVYQMKPQGDFELKGFDRPIALYALGRKKPVSVTKEFAAKELVGREPELEKLDAALAPIFETSEGPGRFAGCIYVDGEAGMGKSYLVETFRRKLDAAHPHGFLWIEAPCDQTLQRSLNPFEAAMREYFHQSPTQGKEENHVHFDDTLDWLIERLPPSFAPLGRELHQARSIFGALLGIRWDGSLYERLNPKDRFAHSVRAISAWIRAESSLQPVVVHLEDAHWIDDDSLQVIEELSRVGVDGSAPSSTGSAPIAILCTARHRDDGSTLRFPVSADVPIVEIPLGPLTPEQIGRVADNARGCRVPDIFRSMITDHAGGNPFYTEEILAYWNESDLHGPLGDSSVSAPSVALLPADVNSVLIARLDRLPPAVKNIVLAAAVIGKEFDLQVLAHMFDDRQKVADHVRDAIKQGIFQPQSGERFRFRNTLLRNAAYEIQSRARLQRLHFRAAEAIKAVHEEDLEPHLASLARHFRRADAPGEARSYMLRAARQAASRYAHLDARRLYRGYLKMVTEPTPESVIARYELARDVLELDGDLGRAADEHRHVIAEAQKLGDKNSEALGWLGLGRVRWANGELSEAREHLEQALAIARSVGNRWSESRVLAHLSLVLKANGETQEARATFEHALRIGQELGIRTEPTVFGGIVQHYETEGRADEALALYEQAMLMHRESA